MHTPGESLALRGMYAGRPWYVQTARLIHDTPSETALLVLPGAECVAPYGYIHQKHGSQGKWQRWQEMLAPAWRLETYRWHTNRFLILLQPEAFYAVIYMWEHATNRFLGYYVNFQLPFQRSACGVDTFDLELDIVIAPNFSWRWKDTEEYQEGIRLGLLRPDWVQGIETAQKDVFARLEARAYPFNGHWLHWIPDPAWAAPSLPTGWDVAESALPPAAVCRRPLTTAPENYPRATYQGRNIYFCTSFCLDAFNADPDRFYAAHSRPKIKSGS